jgi:hypothetical protein
MARSSASVRLPEELEVSWLRRDLLMAVRLDASALFTVLLAR